MATKDHWSVRLEAAVFAPLTIVPVLGGIAIFCLGAFLLPFIEVVGWLQSATWPHITSRAILAKFDIFPEPSTGWKGVDQLLLWLLDAHGSIGLIPIGLLLAWIGMAGVEILETHLNERRKAIKAAKPSATVRK